jgi:hypothetical protein
LMCMIGPIENCNIHPSLAYSFLKKKTMFYNVVESIIVVLHFIYYEQIVIVIIMWHYVS